ncbi:hypothetical protein K504DRAFT_503874 [Pleomassaria siparia CBS 279.74]|uniref:Uncharacterized protein n=1 Tax=Pleomassaria siparia CBS 279.74 TaxID=1314801 RepID=A0A6G1K452_9PLEO|nr:hypothetical protein K504DRAFT_503874 [Pleomassaria siparia CBS 279.74]
MDPPPPPPPPPAEPARASSHHHRQSSSQPSQHASRHRTDSTPPNQEPFAVRFGSDPPMSRTIVDFLANPVRPTLLDTFAFPPFFVVCLWCIDIKAVMAVCDVMGRLMGLVYVLWMLYIWVTRRLLGNLRANLWKDGKGEEVKV